MTVCLLLINVATDFPVFLSAAPVTMLILSKAHTTDQENVTLVTLHLVENRPSVIRCDSLGGYPPPSIDMYIGRRDVTRYFAFRSSCVKVFGPLGNRRLIYAAERSTYNFMPLATDDQQTLSCVATVPGLKPVIENVKLDVDCTYYIYNFTHGSH